MTPWLIEEIGWGNPNLFYDKHKKYIIFVLQFLLISWAAGTSQLQPGLGPGQLGQAWLPLPKGGLGDNVSANSARGGGLGPVCSRASGTSALAMQPTLS